MLGYSEMLERFVQFSIDGNTVPILRDLYIRLRSVKC